MLIRRRGECVCEWVMNHNERMRCEQNEVKRTEERKGKEDEDRGCVSEGSEKERGRKNERKKKWRRDSPWERESRFGILFLTNHPGPTENSKEKK